MQRIAGWAEQGDVSLVAGGIPIAGDVQGSFPGCTVTVYLVGTQTLATLYADDLNPHTPKANPFVADATGYWFFYAAIGRYDVRFSGTGITTPFTIGDLSCGLADSGVSNYTLATLPTSQASEIGRLALVTDATPPGLYYDSGSGWLAVSSTLVTTSTYGGLPAAGTAGRLRAVTDKSRGLWLDTGTRWYPVDGATYDIRKFGAVCDGTTDDTAAIQGAINAAQGSAAGVGGGTVLITGDCACAGQLTITDHTYLAIRGQNGSITYTGTAGPFLTIASSTHIWIEHLKIFYSNASFTGDLVWVGHSITLNTDAAYVSLVNCALQGTSVSTAGNLINFNQCIICRAYDCTFANAVNGVGVALPSGGYANGLEIRGCAFFALTTSAANILSGQSITFDACTFEANPSGQSCGIRKTNLTNFIWGLQVLNSWWGDVFANGGGPWVQANLLLGGVISGNSFFTAGSGANDCAILFTGSTGVQVEGNYGCIVQVSGAANAAITFFANLVSSITNSGNIINGFSRGNSGIPNFG